MGLDDQGIPCTGFVAGWVVQFAPGRLCVTSLPVNHFDAAESELRELRVEVQQHDLVFSLWIGDMSFGGE